MKEWPEIIDINDSFLGHQSSLTFRVNEGNKLHISQLNVLGMTCHACVRSVTHQLNTINGVLKVNVELSRNLVTVQYNEKLTDPMHFKGAISAVGYSLSASSG